MTNLRKLARNQGCMIRVPGVCTNDRETVVLCHIRMIGVSGGGLKAPDLLGAYGCAACHAIVDGQTASEYDAGARRLMLLEGVMRTQYQLISQEIVRW